jgi:hypothetical protein
VNAPRGRRKTGGGSEVISVANLSVIASRHSRALVGTAALAAVPFLFHLNDALGLVVNHFGLTYATAFVIVSLIVEGSWWVAIWFPYIIPVEVTVEILVAVLGIGYAVGW